MTGEAQPGRWRQQWAWRLFQGALFTLPWIGLGLLTLITGRDLGAGLQLSWFLLAMVVLLIGPELWFFLRTQIRGWLPSIAPMAVALLLSLAGLWIAPAAEPLRDVLLRFLKQVVQLDIMLVFVLVPLYFMARGRSLTEMAGPLVLGAVFQAVYSLAQGVHFYEPLAAMTGLEAIFTSNPSILAGSEQLYLGNVLRDVPRFRGTACEPLYLGNFLLLAVPLVGLTGWRRWQRVLTGGLLVTVLILTWSRGAWLAGAGAGLIFLLVAGRTRTPLSWRKMLRVVLVGVGVGVLGFAVGVLAGRPEVWLPWQRLQQTFSTVDWSNLTRLYSMQAAWRAFLLSPVTGIGWGQFGFHFPLLVEPMGLQSMFSWPVVNNFPLAILCETGVLGLGGFLWLVFRLHRNVWRHLVAGPPERSWSVLILVAAVGGIWLQLLTFSQYNLPHIWLGLGLLLGALHTPGQRDQQAKSAPLEPS